MNNFYDEKLNELNELFKENKFDQLLVEIQQEINMPYVPSDFEKELLELLKKVQSINKNVNLNNDEKSLWSLEWIEKILLDEKQKNIHIIAINQLKKMNARSLNKTLKKFLTNENLSDLNKSMLLFILMDQKIDEEYTIIKKNGLFKINPTKNNFDELFVVINNVFKLLDETIGQKDISLVKISKQITNEYFLLNFPIFLDKNVSYYEFTAAIIMLSFNMLGIEESFLNIRNNYFNFEDSIASKVYDKIRTWYTDKEK
ncbi:DUF3196 family protein [Spiroplasma endosymbiont of Labia minor]|uniref:DUF3196 family protein n=1 Tax=Spiroplasma endosymbiont of Labia minor TaxID=3066305 RepID=UPI0030D3182F